MLLRDVGMEGDEFGDRVRVRAPLVLRVEAVGAGDAEAEWLAVEPEDGADQARSSRLRRSS